MSAPAFPITDLLDEDLCYLWLMRARWPGARPVCPGCGKGNSPSPRHRARRPHQDWRCKGCGRVFNLLTDTNFSRTKRSWREIILVLRGFA